MQVFDPAAPYSAADAPNSCQMMDYSYVKKDLNRKEHSKLILQ